MKTSKRRITMLLSSLALLCLLSSCGVDGLDGRAFLSINYTGSQPTYYWDNNSGIPYGFTWGYRYQTVGGSYDYDYEYSDGSGWYGTNSVLYPKAGEEGGLFLDGEDGDHSYCDFYCSYYGSSSDDGWFRNQVLTDTTYSRGPFDFTVNILEGETDTIVTAQRYNGQLISLDKRWRKDPRDGIHPDRPNKLK